MKILISGSTGLVGSALIPALKKKHHQITRLVRQPGWTGDEEILWTPLKNQLDENKIEGFDAVVHLAGENIAEGRWTESKKKAIRDSRVDTTNLLVGSILKLKSPPKTFICASAIGYYGDRKVTPLNEDASPGSGFLPRVCQDWENETTPLKDKNIRVINLRLGVILTPKGGALAKMLLPFKLGVGGKIGPGNQFMSWVSLADVVGIILHTLTNEELSGPVNTVSPIPVTNIEFTKALGRALKRPTIFPMPAFAARLAFGEMADALLLASTRVEPEKLKKSGYTYIHPNIDMALQGQLN